MKELVIARPESTAGVTRFSAHKGLHQILAIEVFPDLLVEHFVVADFQPDVEITVIPVQVAMPLQSAPFTRGFTSATGMEPCQSA